MREPPGPPQRQDPLLFGREAASGEHSIGDIVGAMALDELTPARSLVMGGQDSPRRAHAR